MATCEKLAKCPFYQGKMSMETGLGIMLHKRSLLNFREAVME